MAPRRGSSKPTSEPPRPSSRSSAHFSSDAAQTGHVTSAPQSEVSPPTAVQSALEPFENRSTGTSPLAFVANAARDEQSGPEAEETSARIALEIFHSHLRRLQRRTDTMLKQRMRCRKEMQAWEISHDHLKSSIQALVTTLQDFIDQFNSAASSAPTASSSTSQASRSDSTMDNPTHHQAVVIAASSSIVESCHREYAEDLNLLRQQGTRLKDSMDQLSDLEFRLQPLYDKIAEFLKSPNLDNKPRPDVLAGNVTIPEVDSRTKLTTVPTPELVSEYLDKEGDVKVFRERLRDLEAHYYEGQDAREVVRDRGDPLEVTDEQFERTHRSRRERMEKELDNALQGASDLARRCKEGGYDINYYRFRKPQGLASSRETSTRSGEGDDTPVPPRASETPRSTGIPSMVESWRENITTKAPPGHMRKS